MAKKKKIESFKEFHRLVPLFVEEVNKNQELAIRAMANPLFAIEELGYDISDDVKKQVEHHLRFNRNERKQLQELDQKIEKLVGRKFDLDSAEELESVLFEELKLRKPKNIQLREQIDIREKGAALAQKKEFCWSDPLESLKKKHSVIAPLLDYRKIKNQRSPFASRELYDQLKTGERKLPVSKVKITFRRDLAQHEEMEDA